MKNNRPPLLCYFKLCAYFQNHWQIQTGIQVQIVDFSAHVTLKFDELPWKTIGHLSNVTSSFVHHFIAMCEFKLKFKVRKLLSWVLTSVTLTLTFCIDITFVIGNNSWTFHDNTMTGTLWNRCDRQTDGRISRIMPCYSYPTQGCGTRTRSTWVLNFWYSYCTHTREFQSNSTRTREQVLRYSYEYWHKYWYYLLM